MGRADALGWGMTQKLDDCENWTCGRRGAVLKAEGERIKAATSSGGNGNGSRTKPAAAAKQRQCQKQQEGGWEKR